MGYYQVAKYSGIADYLCVTKAQVNSSMIGQFWTKIYFSEVNWGAKYTIKHTFHKNI